MTGKRSLLIVAVAVILAVGGVLGWRHYLASRAPETARATDTVSREPSAPSGEQSSGDLEPGPSIDEAQLPPDDALPAATPEAQAPPARVGRAPQSLNSLIAHIKALHAACLQRRDCTEAKWWDITVRLYATDAPVHLLELYAAVSRAWRGHLEAGPSADFDRELAIKLMNRAREWGH